MLKIKKRNPFIAFILSIFFPLGQVYNGQIKKGVILYCSMLLLFILSFFTKLQYTYTGFIVFISMFFILFLFIILDAIINALKNKEYELKKYNKWYVYIFIIILSQSILSSMKYIIINIYPQIQAYYIPASSMEPTLINGDNIYVDKMYYQKNKPARGDIVVYIPPNINTSKHYIHRCVAIENDNVSLKNGYLYVNDKRVDETYAIGKTTYDFFSNKKIEGKVPSGMIVVLGDNRHNSSDSRYFGYLPINKIIGRPLYIYWSEERNRIGTIIK